MHPGCHAHPNGQIVPKEVAEGGESFEAAEGGSTLRLQHCWSLLFFLCVFNVDSTLCRKIP